MDTYNRFKKAQQLLSMEYDMKAHYEAFLILTELKKVNFPPAVNLIEKIKKEDLYPQIRYLFKWSEGYDITEL